MPAPTQHAQHSETSSEQGLATLLESRRVILCVGCGGVGKTTTTAALGLAAARRGKRVLCLTIDPARRLAESLGLREMKSEAQQISPELFQKAGVAVPGSMTVMMLDAKSTFDGLIKSLAPTPQKRDQILNNVLYKYISTSLAGTQEYMAMEKLYEVKRDPRWDIILLDTPPTDNALDFLDAPERLVGAIDSAATRWFIQAFENSGKLSLNLLARSAAAILRGIGKLTGGGFLEQVAAFIAEINTLFGSWRKRADEIASALRGPDVAYVLVTTPDPLAIREVLYFAERLRKQNMHRDAYVVNRVSPELGDLPNDDQINEHLLRRGIHLHDDATRRLRMALEDENRLGRRDALHLIALDSAIEEESGAKTRRVDIPTFAYDIHDLERLVRIADILAPPPGAPPRAKS